MEEGTTVLTRMLGGPILLDLHRRSQRRNQGKPRWSPTHGAKAHHGARRISLLFPNQKIK